MISKGEVLSKARKLNLNPHVVEKDYVLSWILIGISNHAQISKNWVFKGGTCIKKCYIRDYRFSEDLDFTIKKIAKFAFETKFDGFKARLVFYKSIICRCA